MSLLEHLRTVVHSPDDVADLAPQARRQFLDDVPPGATDVDPGLIDGHAVVRR